MIGGKYVDRFADSVYNGTLALYRGTKEAVSDLYWDTTELIYNGISYSSRAIERLDKNRYVPIRGIAIAGTIACALFSAMMTLQQTPEGKPIENTGRSWTEKRIKGAKKRAEKAAEAINTFVVGDPQPKSEVPALEDRLRE